MSSFFVRPFCVVWELIWLWWHIKMMMMSQRIFPDPFAFVSPSLCPSNLKNNSFCFIEETSLSLTIKRKSFPFAQPKKGSTKIYMWMDGWWRKMGRYINNGLCWSFSKPKNERQKQQNQFANIYSGRKKLKSFERREKFALKFLLSFFMLVQNFFSIRNVFS